MWEFRRGGTIPKSPPEVLGGEGLEAGFLHSQSSQGWERGPLCSVVDGWVVLVPDYSAIHTLAGDSLPHLLNCSVPHKMKYSSDWGGEDTVRSPTPMIVV